MEQFVFHTMNQRGEGEGGYSSISVTNGCHTNTWPTNELNNDHALGNNTRTCGLRIKHLTLRLRLFIMPL